MMRPAIQPQPGEDVSLLYGVIKSRVGSLYYVQGQGSLIQCERAAGCLLEPEPGDQVLVSESPPGQGFILTVLRRGQDGPFPISVPSGLTIQAGDGPVTLAGRNILVAGTEEVSTVTARWEMKAAEAGVDVGRLSFSGGRLEARIARVKTVISALETSAGRLIQRLGRWYRRVDDFEDAQCGRFRMRVKESMRVQADRATLDAEKSIDLDAEKIRLG